MTSRRYRLLPETSRTSDLVECDEFTVVTGDGEIYTSFTIVRITHEATDARGAWTHLAEVTRITDGVVGKARLRIVARVIEESTVTMQFESE